MLVSFLLIKVSRPWNGVWAVYHHHQHHLFLANIRLLFVRYAEKFELIVFKMEQNVKFALLSIVCVMTAGIYVPNLDK